MFSQIKIENVQQEITESSNKSTFGFWFLKIFILLTVAQVVKVAVVYLSLPTFLNNQFAFSLPIPNLITLVVYLIVLVTIISVIVTQGKNLEPKALNGLILIFSGGLSNFIERIAAGHVVDYIFILSGVFNLADLFIIFGVLILLTSYRRQT